MNGKQTAPYGTWKSPITADLIVSHTVGLSNIQIDGDDIYWLEMRPEEGGRYAMVHHLPALDTEDLMPAPWNARTRVHEYGGGAYLVADGAAYFSHFDDQRLYRLVRGESPEALTAQGPLRFADAVMDRKRNRLICVCEDHGVDGKEPRNTIAGVDLSSGEVTHLISGNDFYATPRLSPEGDRLVWLAWNHPHMPWDCAELWMAPLDESGTAGEGTRIAGGGEEAACLPVWSPDGVLHFITDPTGWWNLYRYVDEEVQPLLEMAAEFGVPHWVFGQSTYDFLPDGRIACTYKQEGFWRLAALNPESGELSDVPTPFTQIGGLRTRGEELVFVGASPTEPASVVRLELRSGEISVLRRSFSQIVEGGYLSTPEPLEFPTSRDRTAFGFFYPPTNIDFAGPEGEKPPLLVVSHGGPTASASTALSLSIQFWTSRGIGVLDVDYGGSNGYGRAYRERLRGQWGIVDLDDCEAGAKFLVEAGRADPDRLMVRGGSAGGFTTLALLAFRDTFKAGASYFGVSDLEALAQDTHKFESRYLDGLVGPYPERRERYVERSPIHGADGLSCPIIFFQGLEDAIVPPNQAEKMVEVLREKGIPVAYLAFPGEQHGFRRAENIRRTLEAELHFYGRVFHFTPADPIDPVEIENL
jgi:dipeptidyl aminopeptidase/acylaminoacyl peptidase